VLVMAGPDGASYKARINEVLTFEGLNRVKVAQAGPGDIVLVNGIENVGIGETITDPADPQPLPMLQIDEPTLTMNFCVNTSPLAGREGKFVTSRQIWDRLQRAALQRGAAREGDRRGRRLRGLGPRRTAPDHPAGRNAPRGLRAGREQAARGVQGHRRRSASRSSW
jgi:hypothetical protein